MNKKWPLKYLRRLYVEANIEEFVKDYTIITADFIDDMVVGMCGAPPGSTWAKFTEPHGIKYNPSGGDMVFDEAIFLLTKYKLPLKKFKALNLTQDDVIGMFIRNNNFPKEMSGAEKVMKLRKILVKYYRPINNFY